MVHPILIRRSTQRRRETFVSRRNETLLFSVCLTLQNQRRDPRERRALSQLCDDMRSVLEWNATQKVENPIHLERYRHSSSSHTTRTLEKDAPSSRDDLFSRSKCLLRILKASVWPRYGRARNNERRRIEQREQRQHSSKTFTIDSDGDEDDENDYEDDFDDSDDDDGRGETTTTTTTRREKEVSRNVALRNQQRRSRVPTREEEEEVLLLRATVSTNFQSAGSFWSR